MTKKPSPTDQATDLKATHELRATLHASLDQAEWAWITKHLERDAVIVVTADLDLVEAGVQIAQDAAALVQSWIADGKISKPSREQLDAWNDDPSKKFQTLVVQPYVLVQELLH